MWRKGFSYQRAPLRCAGPLFEGAASCTVTPTLTGGPYYLDGDSGFEAASHEAAGPGGPRRPGGGNAPTDSTRYLRGAQLSNGDGIAEITTIYPVWYRGRTVHIDAKVPLSNEQVLTTQLYSTTS